MLGNFDKITDSGSRNNIGSSSRLGLNADKRDALRNKLRSN